jgi:hypothetical protein
LEDSCNGKSQDDRLSYEAIIETTTNKIGRSPRPNLAVSGSRSGPLTGSDSDHWPRMSDVGSTAEKPMVCLTLRWREMDSNFRFRARGAIDLSSRLSSMFLKMFVSAKQIYGRDRAGGSCRVAPERQTVALPPEAAVIR